MNTLDILDGYWQCKPCKDGGYLVWNAPNYTQCRKCGESNAPDTPQTPQKGANLNVMDIPLHSTAKKAKTRKKGRKQKYTQAQLEQSHIMPVALPKTRNRAQTWLYNGGVLDSTTEKERYIYLERLEARGIISELIRPEAIEIRPQLVIPANSIHGQFTQQREVYTPDFAYRWRDYFFTEDVKSVRWIKKENAPNILKPKLSRGDSNKVMRLQELWSKYPKRIFLYTVYHGDQWHYFNSNQSEIQFRLEQQVKDNVA